MKPADFGTAESGTCKGGFRQVFGRALERKAGDPVTEGETLVEIETEKIVCEVESPAAGTLDKICAAPGTVAPVGETIGVIS